MENFTGAAGPGWACGGGFPWTVKSGTDGLARSTTNDFWDGIERGPSQPGWGESKRAEERADAGSRPRPERARTIMTNGDIKNTLSPLEQVRRKHRVGVAPAAGTSRDRQEGGQAGGAKALARTTRSCSTH